MINWGDFTIFFSTGISSEILIESLLITVIAIIVGQFWKRVHWKLRYVLWVLLAEYVFVVACSTVICRGVKSFKYARLKLTPFWTYQAVLEQVPGVSVWDIILNVVLFVPLGFFVKLLYPNIKLWKVMLIAIGCSILIETNQYIFGRGVTQIDDVMHNTIGAILGWLLAKLTIMITIFINDTKP